MPVQKAKPTSPGRRFVVSLKKNNLHRGKPFKALIEPKSKKGGRNNNGRITVRHQGGGHKRHYRVIDFKRNKLDIPAIVERIEYDPNRSANIALLKYADGERRYILCPSKMEIGAEIISSDKADIKDGIRLMPLSLFYERHTRICRPVGLSSNEIDQIVDYAVSREGDQYDLKNIFDLARYEREKYQIHHQS